MKTSFIALITVSLMCLSSFTAAGAEKKKTTTTTTTTTTTYRDPAEGDGHGMRVGFGFATYGGVSGGHAVSALIGFGGAHSLQLTTAITSTDPFRFGFGGLYRITVAGTQELGFHAGLGFNLGTGAPSVADAAAGKTNSFFLDIYPVAGFKFSLGGAASNVYLSFDGGPMFHATPSPFQFSLQPISALTGVAIHYMF